MDGPHIDCIDTENAGPQIYAVVRGDDPASAARLRRADLSTMTCCALCENVVLRSAVGGGGACTLSAEALPLPAVWVCFNVLAKQESHVDMGVNRGESWGSKWTKVASVILEWVIHLPKCRDEGVR